MLVLDEDLKAELVVIERSGLVEVLCQEDRVDRAVSEHRVTSLSARPTSVEAMESAPIGISPGKRPSCARRIE